MTETLAIVRPPTPTGGYCHDDTQPAVMNPAKRSLSTATVSDPIRWPDAEAPAAGRAVPGSWERSDAGRPRQEMRQLSSTGKCLCTGPGTFSVRLISSAGLALKKTITIERGNDKGGSFMLDYVGDIAPGKEFTVRAKVTNPVAGQQLTLLPLPPA